MTEKRQENEIETEAAGGNPQAGEVFAEFCEIIAQLRGEDGCPWDRAQTFESLKECMINEMTEAIAGIDLYQQSGKAENLCEELGDVLLQVVLLAQIAKEQGLFDIRDVIETISRKMVRRHPHVFPGEDGARELVSWEEIKREEKKNRTPEEAYAEKVAFRAAAGQIICHLSER